MLLWQLLQKTVGFKDTTNFSVLPHNCATGQTIRQLSLYIEKSQFCLSTHPRSTEG